MIFLIVFVTVAFLVSVAVLLFYPVRDLDLRIRELEKAKVDKMIDHLIERDLRRSTNEYNHIKDQTDKEEV